MDELREDKVGYWTRVLFIFEDNMGAKIVALLSRIQPRTKYINN